MALTDLSSFPLPNFLLGSLKEFPGLDWSGRLDLEASKLTSIVIKAWHYKCALIRIAQFAVDCSFILNSMLLNRVELGENRVIYNRLRNIGPATAGSAGPVPAPLTYYLY